MSDSQTTTVPTTPHVPAGQPNGQPTPAATPAPSAPATPSAEPTQQTQEPYRAFASQDELDTFVKGAKSQAERSAVRKLAKDMGFEDADEMREALASLRQAQGGQQPAQPGAESPAQTAQPNADATRLSMALKVGAELNLPAALISRLQGDSEEAMKADAEALIGLMGSGTPASRGPGIPPVPAGNQPVTFTRAQLGNAKFVRENADAIRQAAAQGRIVNS